MGIAHFTQAMKILKEFEFEKVQGTTAIEYEPVGVVGMITPWNWPINQIACKVAPALAAGCTMILKPSEIAPMNALLFARSDGRGGRAARRVQSRQRRRADGGRSACRIIPTST